MPTSQRFSGHYLLTQLIFLSLFSQFANSSETIGNAADDEINISIDEQQLIEPYYFTHEIDFLAKQSMTLGGYSKRADDADKKTTTDMIDNEEITRLRFIEKSLQIELDYIRSLKAMKKGITHNESFLGETTKTTPTSESGGVTCDEKDKKKMTDIPNFINSTISGATWPTWASTADEPVDELPQIQTIDHKYDYDWIVVNGFALMHQELECSEHAYDQKKPLYTSDMWSKLWKTFQESTLFPFPIPKEEECHDLPFYVDHTTDNKGRGNFASRNITKGALIQAGRPNTVFFLDADSWFRFVTALPKMMACDVMEWTWQQDLTDTGNIVLCLNLDEAVFFNDGGWDDSINMEIKERTSLDFHATRDIEKGEEFVYDYSQFEFDTELMNL